MSLASTLAFYGVAVDAAGVKLLIPDCELSERVRTFGRHFTS